MKPAWIGIAALVLGACTIAPDEAGARTADIDPCSLITDADLDLILGVVPPADESEPAGPFTGCSWGTGLVLVSIATSDTVITAPGEGECPSAELGEQSFNCPGTVMFLIDGIHVSVSTIDPNVEEEHLLAFAERVLVKLEDR